MDIIVLRLERFYHQDMIQLRCIRTTFAWAFLADMPIHFFLLFWRNLSKGLGFSVVPGNSCLKEKTEQLFIILCDRLYSSYYLVWQVI